MTEDRKWVVERTWIVRARTATEALEATMGGKLMPDQVRTYEGSPRPWGEEPKQHEVGGPGWTVTDLD
jgi:hypothetical protein